MLGCKVVTIDDESRDWWVSLSVFHIELSGGQPQQLSTIMLYKS